jgi:hypothetical protein
MANTKKASLEDLISREARALATAIIEDKLSKLDPPLPLPKDSALEIHIDQLLSIDPSIIERAKTRVEAKVDAYSQSLAAIGLELQLKHSDAIDIELE